MGKVIIIATLFGKDNSSELLPNYKEHTYDINKYNSSIIMFSLSSFNYFNNYISENPAPKGKLIL